MSSHSPRDRSRSPLHTNEISIIQSPQQKDTPSTNTNKIKKENESQQRLKSLKTFIQTLTKESASIDDEHMKTIESACVEEYQDVSIDRIRRMIRSILKVRKSQLTNPSSSSHQDHSTTTNHKKNRSNLTSNNTTNKSSDLVPSPTSTLSAFDADFLRQAFSQQFQPSALNLSAYFSAPSNGNNPLSSLFRPNFPSSNFLQSLTNPTSLVPPMPPSLISSPHSHSNGTTSNNDSSTSKVSKQTKLSANEANSIRVLVNAYREAAVYLCRSADELEQLI